MPKLDDAWPDLIPLGQPPPRGFPVAALPAPVRVWAVAASEALQVDLGMVAMLAIGMGAAVAQRSIRRVHVREGWTEPPGIYVLIAVGPANRKSAAFRLASAAAEAWQAERAAAVKDTHTAALARQEALRRESARAKDPDEAARLAVEADRTEIPVSPSFIVDDVTPEAMECRLAEQGAVVQLAAEGCGLVEGMGPRYRDSRGASYSVYLKAHGGDRVTTDRVGRQRVDIPDPRLTIVGTTQPDTLRSLSKVSGARATGLLARFAYVLPANRVGHRVSRPPPMSDELRRAYDDMIRALLDRSEPARLDGPHTLRFSVEADDALCRFEEELEPRLRSDLAPIADWAGKLAGLCVRIAGALHMVEHHRGLEPWTVEIAASTVAAAIDIGAYLLDHARSAFDAMAADPELEAARVVWRVVEREGWPEFSKRDLHRALAGRTAYRRADSLDGPLAVLEQHGLVRRQDVVGGAGRPTCRYEVRPCPEPSRSARAAP